MSSTCRRAFTLVELLVVIGIVVVLIAILLPVLSAARERADATKCASNVRQVILAMSAYEADHRSYPIAHDACYGRQPWMGGMIDKCWVDALLEMRYLVGPDIVNRKLDVLACPSVDESRRWTEPIDPGWLSRCIDYGYNWYTNVPLPDVNEPYYRARTFRGQRGRMARGGGRKVLMTETWAYNSYSDAGGSRMWSAGAGYCLTEGGGWGSLTPQYEVRHMRGKAINVAYMAGNVELLYPPPPPEPPDYAGHPLSRDNFMYEGP
jgi:prepilin-type N-terminal cleavage/methylation domain-containing protein